MRQITPAAPACRRKAPKEAQNYQAPTGRRQCLGLAHGKATAYVLKLAARKSVVTSMKLFTYWRSQASFRVRVALRLKRLDAELICLDLLKGDQFAATYRSLNPETVVPTLIDGDEPPLVQSLAIVEYLDERYPDPPLLPPDAPGRARKYLEHELHIDEPTRMKWLGHWLDAGSRAIEDMLAHDARTGRFCHGDR